MEKRQPLKYQFETVSFYEARIINKNTGELAKTITSKKIQEVELDINIWIKCGKFELERVEKVERQQVKLAV